MKGGIQAWETEDQQSLPPGARRKAWKPRPNFLPGLFVDPRARKSRREACRVALDLIRSAKLDRAQALVPNYVRVEAVAIPRACNALSKMWEALTGKQFAKTADNEATGKGIVFLSAGPKRLAAVMTAIDAEVGLEQVHSWLKKPNVSKT